jgi:alanine-synthesizing transaminase
LLEKLVAIAAKYRLLLMADEIYDGILYDDNTFQPLAPLAGDVPCLTFSGLSKVHRACGWRVGWAVLSGDPLRTGDYHHALDLLGALRLCANVPGQFAIEAALKGGDTITELTAPGGRLHASRQAVLDAVAKSAFLSVVAPQGALYAFPKIDTARLPEFDDYRFALDLLETEHVLIVPGSSFNVPYRDHFRVTLLPQADEISEVFRRIERSLSQYADRGGARQSA